MAGSSGEAKRQRGNIERRTGGYRVRVSAGKDPATGERLTLKETVPVEPPGDRKTEQAAYKKAQKVLTRLQGEADSLKIARTKSTFGALLDRWLPNHELDPTTRMNYESMIRRHIRPVLGDVPLLLLTRDASERLEKFYADLRRCSQRCSGKPFVEHQAEGKHDCSEHRCTEHRCKPYAASSVRQMHAIISGALSAAVRWGWIAYNPAPAVRLPAKRRPQPRPPSAADMARIIEAANKDSAEWGTYLWLSAVTGARRGEVVALQWEDIDLEAGVVVLDENYVRGPDGMILKDTKTHQGRRVSLDEDTVTLLHKHKADATSQLDKIGLALTGKTWVFSAKPDLSMPRDPSSLTRKYSKLVAGLGIETQLKELRHYSATELLTAGVDLRTVAGRLGHGDGTTTLRHYAGWVGAADKAAASTMGSRMPKLQDS